MLLPNISRHWTCFHHQIIWLYLSSFTSNTIPNKSQLKSLLLCNREFETLTWFILLCWTKHTINLLKFHSSTGAQQNFLCVHACMQTSLAGQAYSTFCYVILFFILCTTVDNTYRRLFRIFGKYWHFPI